MIKEGIGALGRVTITVAPTNPFILYDATTTSALLRAPSKATSTLNILAAFPASPTVGTYEYDAVFTDGLLYVAEGVAGTSTILYK